MLLYLVVITVICGSSAVDPPCPDVEGLPDFDFHYHSTGTWYTLGIYKNNLNPGTNCMVIEYVEQFKNNSGRFHISNLKNGLVTSWEGLGEAATDGVNQLITTHYLPDKTMVIPLNILKADNKHYTIGYKCIYDENKKTRKELLWIVFRNRIVEKNIKQEVDDYIKNSPLIDGTRVVWETFTEEQCRPVDSLVH